MKNLNQRVSSLGLSSVFLCLFFYTSFLQYGYSQSTEWKAVVDSLNQVISTTTIDTIKVNAMNELTREYLWEQDTGIIIGYRSLALARKIGWKKGEAFAHYNIGFPFRTQGSYDSTLFHHQAALAIFEEIDYKVGIAKVYNEFAFLSYTKSEIPQAIEYLKIARKLELEIGNMSRASRANTSTGMMYKLQGNYAAALDQYQQALSVQENIKDTFLIVETLGQIGAIHLTINENEKASDYFKRVISIYRQAKLKGDPTPLNDAKTKLGTIAMENGKYVLALDYLKQVANIDRESKDWALYAPVARDIGFCYFGMNDFSNATKYYNEALMYFRNLKDKRGLSSTLLRLSELSYAKENIRKAISQATEAFDIALKAEDIEGQAAIHLALSKFYESNENAKKALSNHKAYIVLRDSIYSEENTKLFTQTEMQYSFDKEKLTDSLAFQQEKVVFQSNLANEKRTRYFLLGFAGLLGLFGFNSYRNGQRRRKTNETLKRQNEEIEIKNKQNETLLKEIHHRVKNNLQTVSSLLSLQSETITDPNALDAVQESRNRVASMALIHENLYQGENLASIEMRDYFKAIGQNVLDSFGEKAEGVTLEVDMPSIELDVDMAVPVGLITNELMTNSLKYAFKENEGAKISISMVKEKGNIIQLKIADNGTYINPSENKQSGTGFGAMLIQLLTTQLEGQLKQITTDGTATILRFPINAKQIAS